MAIILAIVSVIGVLALVVVARQEQRSPDDASRNARRPAPTMLTPSVEMLETYESVYFGDGTDGEFVYDSDEFRVEARIPSDELGRPPVEVAKYADQVITDFVERNEDMRADFAERGVTPPDLQWQLRLSFETFTSDNLTSYLLEAYEYTGGAHSMVNYSSLTYDDEWRLVGLEDIVGPVDAAIEDFSTEATTILAERLGRDFFEDGVSTDSINWQVWYVDDDEIAFVFPPYQVAPFSLGRQEVRFSLVQISTSL